MSPTPHSSAQETAAALARLSPGDPAYAANAVDIVLTAALRGSVSDVHLLPTPDGLAIAWRIDGLLQPVACLPKPVAANVVSRLKVLAGLLTYKTDLPQEGRLAVQADQSSTEARELRLSTFPTLYGEKAVVRCFAPQATLERLADLGLPEDVAARLAALLSETDGAVLFTGPAGSGKTTTAYACLREIAVVSHGGRALASLEDPVEVPLAGVAQTQVQPHVGFDLARGISALLRQDPEVIFVGEIRDPATAEGALQAALTGHLLLSTLHAQSAVAALSRLSELGVPPYALASGLRAIVHQRLVRKLCACARPASAPSELCGLQVAAAHVPAGCAQCHQTGYRGRMLLAELLEVETTALLDAILQRASRQELARAAASSPWRPLADQAREAIVSGLTSPAEVCRVLGFSFAVDSAKD